MVTNPRRIARIIGLLFLITILGGAFAQGFVSDRLITFSDAAATASHILTHRGLFQLGFAVYLIEMVSQVAAAALWYVLLRPVSRPLALAAAFIELAGAIVKTFRARVLHRAAVGADAHTRWRFDDLARLHARTSAIDRVGPSKSK